MSDWQVGDLAVCVDASPKYGPTALEVGRVYLVTGLEIPGEISPQNGVLNNVSNELALILEGVPCFGRRAGGGTWAGYNARRFRKVEPPKHEACEPEFIQLLKRSKRKVSA